MVISTMDEHTGPQKCVPGSDGCQKGMKMKRDILTEKVFTSCWGTQPGEER